MLVLLPCSFYPLARAIQILRVHYSQTQPRQLVANDMENKANSRQKRSIKLLVLTTLVVLGLLAAIVWSFQNSETMANDSKDSKKTRSPAAQKPIEYKEKFERLLLEGNVANLKAHAEARREIEDEVVLLQLDNIKKQIQVADRIDEISKTEEDKQYSVELKLNGLVERELLMLQHDVADEQSTEELRVFALKALLLNSEMFAVLGKSAKRLVKVSEFLSERNIENARLKAFCGIRYFRIK